jgi:hypothetical protein
MKLITLLNKANQAYADGFLSTYYDEKTGEKKNGAGDGLAKFIVTEIIETYDASSNARDQVTEARRVIQRGIDDLDGVHRALGELLN